MSRPPLHVMILWHMHQPYYKDVQREEYMMPWVRLHATKDYLDMPLLAAKFDGLRVTFNMVPSLLEQIEDYGNGTAHDRYLTLAGQNAEELTLDERVELLRDFFSAHEGRMIRASKRYADLLGRRGSCDNPDELRRMARLFSPAEMRDLQTWFFLAWIDPMLREADPKLAGLVAKDRNFTEEEKKYVIEAGRQITARIIPEMGELWKAGNIEVSTTPFYHPILPLLIDTSIARRARPEANLPSRRFAAPEDAKLQIELGLNYCEKLMGRRPAGMWPSEGSVCPELVPMLAANGVKWIATDEEILAQSLGIDRFARDRDGRVLDPDRLYRPYSVQHDGSEVAIFFRDHQLSDLIGFRYAGVAPESAASDMLRRLERIYESLDGAQGPHVVSIILDGENCWEHYERDGVPFLSALYQGLVSRPALKTVTPSEYLELAAESRRLERLASGSWINHDFSIWIGHPEDNAAWDLLAQARQDLAQPMDKAQKQPQEKDNYDRALKSLLIAEGSDWNWWYGDDHSSEYDDQFDRLYRQHLTNAYMALGQQPPGRLMIPISRGGDMGLQAQPRALIEPKLDGRVSNFFEWYAAGLYNPKSGGDAMHQAESEIESLYFGFSRSAFYLRVDLVKSLMSQLDQAGAQLVVYLFSKRTFKILCPLSGERRPTARVLEEDAEQGWVDLDPMNEAAVEKIVEMRFDCRRFQIDPNQMLRFQVALEQGSMERERCPSRAPLSVCVPGEDFEESMWTV
ncbi:hypothetical protein LLG95_06135 [bacterium]|nr:hypothetical protein [bacterium]